MEENINIIYNYAFIECNDALQFSFTGKKANYKRKESHNEMFYFDGAPSSNTIGAHRDQCIYWRNKKLATNYVSTGSDVTNKYTVLDQQAITLGADNYPGLRYVTSTEDSLLDSAYTNETGVTVVTGGEEYAIIKKFTTPSIYVEDYYEQVIIDGTTYNKLTIPEEIDGKAVKIIDSTAFQSNNDIQIVKFSKNLVQIKNKAFYKCPNIAQLDFDSCENLIEISYSVFQDNNYKTTNQVTSLRLPYCLEYLGDYAFAYFTKTNELVFDAPYVNNAPVNSSCLRVMGDMAFFNLGSAVASPNITVTLPKSLNDQDAADAKMYNFHSPWPDSYGLHENPSSRWCAVGKYAFDGALGVVTVAMEPDPDHLYKSDGTTINMDYTCSLYSNAFTRCTNLARFQANTNVKTIGNDCFKNCNNFCEAFFSSRKVDSTLDYPWAVSDNGTAYGGAMFSGTTTNLVVYIDGAKAPGKLDDLTLDSDPSNQALGHKWNAENGDSYPNELNNASNKNNDKMQYFGRSHIATFYNIDFENNNGLIYWNLHGSGNDAVNSIRTEPPTKKADYDEGVVVLAKHGEETVSNTTKSYYTVARYFTNNTASHVSSLVDLTAVPSFDYTNDEITVIGDEAFASSASLKDNVVAAGHGFILPTTIKSINERAFYRRTDTGQNYNGIHGVKVVTYRHAKDNTAASEKVMKADGSSYFTETTINNEPDTIEQYLSKISGSSNQYLYSGYCLLPDGVKVIGRNAFYNHIFGTIKIGTGLEFLGNSAFFTIPYNASKPRARTTSISIGTNSYFEVTNDGGVYYKKSATEKMLVYQTAYDTTNRTLTIQNNTIAVGMHACANTYYQTIKLPTTLTTIYGGGFQKNLSLTTVCATDNNTLSNLQYIGAMENAGGVPVASASGSFYIDLMDYRLYEKSDSTWSAVDYGLYKTGSSISGVATVWPQEAITAAIDGETNNSIYFIDLSTNKLYTYINSNWSEVASVTFSNEFYDATVAAHFDNYDYRDYAYSKRGIIESLYGAFANCTALKTLNFREMTGLKKIGYGAFSSCTNLEEMTGNPTSNASPTYNCAVYYESSGSYVKENVTGYSNLKKGVLDLTNCPNLTSIGKGAFLNCNKMKVLLLPDNKPNGATESNLYIGYDPEAKLYGQTTPPNDAILTAGKGTKVLIKEKITVANTNYSSTAKYHYNSGVFSDGTSDTSNKVYYYIASASDVPSGDTSTYHYWTYDGNSTTSFVLFETATAARAYSFS